MSDDRAERLADVAARIEAVDRMLPGLEPTTRRTAAKMLRWLHSYREAIEDDDPNLADVIADRTRGIRKWGHDSAAFDAAVETGAVVVDPEARTVTIYPDRIQPGQHDVVMSHVSELVDTYSHRSVGGYPKGRPQSEKAAKRKPRR